MSRIDSHHILENLICKDSTIGTINCYDDYDFYFENCAFVQPNGRILTSYYKGVKSSIFNNCKFKYLENSQWVLSGDMDGKTMDFKNCEFSTYNNNKEIFYFFAVSPDISEVPSKVVDMKFNFDGCKFMNPILNNTENPISTQFYTCRFFVSRTNLDLLSVKGMNISMKDCKNEFGALLFEFDYNINLKSEKSIFSLDNCENIVPFPRGSNAYVKVKNCNNYLGHRGGSDFWNLSIEDSIVNVCNIPSVSFRSSVSGKTKISNVHLSFPTEKVNEHYYVFAGSSIFTGTKVDVRGLTLGGTVGDYMASKPEFDYNRIFNQANSFCNYNSQVLNTTYATKMQQEGIYEDFITYMDEKTAYDLQQRELDQQRQLAFENRENQEQTYEEWLAEQPMLLPADNEPQPSEALLKFKEKYLG